MGPIGPAPRCIRSPCVLHHHRANRSRVGARHPPPCGHHGSNGVRQASGQGRNSMALSFRMRPRAYAAIAASGVVLAVTAAVAVPASADSGGHQSGDRFKQTNLVSDRSDVGALIVDPDLQNAWGLAMSATSPIWVSDNASGVFHQLSPRSRPAAPAPPRTASPWPCPAAVPRPATGRARPARCSTAAAASWSPRRPAAARRASSSTPSPGRSPAGTRRPARPSRRWRSPRRPPFTRAWRSPPATRRHAACTPPTSTTGTVDVFDSTHGTRCRPAERLRRRDAAGRLRAVRHPADRPA